MVTNNILFRAFRVLNGKRRGVARDAKEQGASLRCWRTTVNQRSRPAHEVSMDGGLQRTATATDRDR